MTKALVIAGTLSILSVAVAQADYIENIIKDHDVSTLKVMLIPSPIRDKLVNSEKIGHYLNLAKEEVEKCAQKCNKRWPVDSIAALDLIAIGAFTGLTMAGFASLYEALSKEHGKAEKSIFVIDPNAANYRGWRSYIAPVGALFLAVGSTLRAFNDLKKNIMEHRNRHKENLKKAEQIALLLEELAVA